MMRARDIGPAARVGAVAVVVLAAVVGLQVAPVVLLESGVSDQPADAGIAAAAEEPREEIWQDNPFTDGVGTTIYVEKYDVVLANNPGSGAIQAYDPKTGERKWRMDVSGAGGDIGEFDYDAKRDNIVMVTRNSEGIESWDWRGSRNWRVNRGDTNLYEIDVAPENDKYYIASYDNAIYQFDPESQSRDWVGRTDYAAYSVHYDAQTDTVFSGTTARELYAYDASDGSQKWRQTVSSTSGSQITGIHSNGTHVFTIGGLESYSVEISSGNVDDTVDYAPNDENINRGSAYDEEQGILYTARGGVDYNARPVAIDVETFEVAWVGDTINDNKDSVATDTERIFLGDNNNDGEVIEGFGTGYESDKSLSGTVTDADGNPIEGASVEAVNDSTGSTEATATTDVNGSYEMFVESGDYNVTASGAGYSPTTKSVTVSGDTTLNFTLTSDTSISDPDPPDGATVSEPPVQLSVLANSTNQSVQSIDVEFYKQDNGTVDPDNDTQIGSRTVAPGERATVTWDPPPGTYRWYAVGTADSGARDTGGPYRLGVGEADIIDGSEQPPDGANVRPTDNVDLAVDVRVQDDATVEFYDYETGDPSTDPLIGSQSVSSGTSTASTRWYSDERDASEEWYAVLSDSTGTRDTAGAFAFGAGGQVVARDAETGEVIDDRTVRFDTTYPGGSETFDRVPANLNLSKVNADEGDRIRIDVRAQDYYERTIEVSGKQSDADVFLERGANWSYNPSSDDPDDSASVEDDADRFISRFRLKDQTGRYPASNSTLTVRADIDGDGQTDLVHRSSFGAANRIDVRVKRDRRYQLSVKNDAGDSRGLGGWTATQPDTTTLTISRVTEDIEIDQGYGVDAVVKDGTLKIYYRDYETRAERLDLEVREYPDGPYLENRTLTDVENATITIALNESQAEKTWQVDYEGSRVGVETANISGQVTTGASGRVPLPVGSDVLTAGALVILAIVGALFTGPLSAVGSVGMVGVASVLYFIGWLPIDAAALWVAAIIAVGSVLRSGGGRLG